MAGDNKTLSIAVLSGKGGVGKSNLALNLAFAINRKAAKVLIIDCDLGLANLDVLLGLAPQHNIQSLLEPDVKAADLAIHLADGLDILPANSGLLDTLEADSLLPDIIADKLDEFAKGYDFIILDVGAGISGTALAFGAMTLMRLMVITPEPTSLTDSYALIKVLASRYGVKDHFVLVNQVATAKEEEMAFKRLYAASSHFLNINPTLIGSVHNDPKLVEAVRQQKPVIKAFPTTRASNDIAIIAEKLIKLRNNILPKISGRAPLIRPEVNKV